MKPYPKPGDVFELELDGDAQENSPLVMVENSGLNPQNWRYNGRLVEGRATGRFVLVQKGGQWEEIARETGNSTEGQWIQAFKAMFSEENYFCPVGVHDNAWIFPYDIPKFPCYFSLTSNSDFYPTDTVLAENWLWIVRIR